MISTVIVNDIEALWQHLSMEANHTDWMSYHVLADAYEEVGDESASQVLRWLARTKLYPRRSPPVHTGLAPFSYDWWFRITYGMTDKNCVIPFRVYRRLTRYSVIGPSPVQVPCVYVEFRTFRMAVEDLFRICKASPRIFGGRRR